MTGRTLGLLGVVVVAVAAALRFLGLGAWSIDGDELYSWYDSARMIAGDGWPEGPRTYPLGYLGMAAGVALLGEGEAALRLFPALCGLAAVAALAWMRRDVLDSGAALAAAALAAISPWLVYHAQTARFYGPLLLFATLTTLWSLPGPGRRPWAAAGAFVLALLCHPSAVLLLPGLAWTGWRERSAGRATGRAALLAAVLVGGAWLVVGDAVLAVLDRALGVSGGVSYAGRRFVLGLGYNLGPEVGLLAVVGVVLALRRRTAHGDVLVVTTGVGAAALLAAALAGVSVHQRYAMALLPAILLLAGTSLAGAWRRSRVLGVVLSVLVVAAPMPKLVDHYRQGNRSDYRAAAAWLAEHATPEDILVADEHATLELYLRRAPGFEEVVTHEAPLPDKMMHGFVRNKREVWVLLKSNRLSGHYPGDFMDWLGEHFDEAARIGRPPAPLVRHDNVLIVSKRRVRIPTIVGPDGGGGEEGR